MTLAALRIGNDVSYVSTINHDIHFAWQAQCLVNPLTAPPLTFHTFPEVFHRRKHEEVHTHKLHNLQGRGSCVYFKPIAFGQLQKSLNKTSSMAALIEDEQNDHLSVGSLQYMNL